MDLNPIDFVIYGLPLLLAVPLHEAAHGFVANRCGDPTAADLGRVTFNPFKHIDPIGTIALPLFLIIINIGFIFGWAKPVPVNFRRLRNLRRDMVLVAAAGPAINITLAFASAIALRVTTADLVTSDPIPWFGQMFAVSLLLNVALAIFNMVPLLPLDGGRVLTGLLPPKLAVQFAKTEKFGFPILIGVLLLIPALGKIFGQDWNLFSGIIAPPIFAVADGIMSLVGIR